MKIVIRVIVVLAVLAGLALGLVIFRGGHVVKESVNRLGPRVLGVEVTLESAHFHPLRGYISLHGLTIGNPEGFHTENLFAVRQLEVDLNMRSLLSDTIIIDRIFIDSPQITYEVGLRRTNLGTLIAQLEERYNGDQEAEDVEIEPLPEEDVLEDAGKTVVIKELILADARAQVSATAVRGRVVPIQLSTITLNDLGGEDQSLTQIITQVVRAILGAVTNAVGGAGDALGEGLSSALEGIGGLSGRAADGARAVTGAVGDGARGLRDRIRRGETDDEAETQAEPESIVIDELTEPEAE